MYFGAIKKTDVADGPGVRVTLFVSGCSIHCPGCHNPAAQDFKYGQEFSDNTLSDILTALQPDYIEGFTLCGGEPFAVENQQCCYNILKKIRETYPGKSIWAYSGYYLETIPHTAFTNEILKLIDVLVEGPFILDLRDITSYNVWRGSTNQRILDIPETLKAGRKIYLKNISNNC